MNGDPMTRGELLFARIMLLFAFALTGAWAMVMCWMLYGILGALT